MVQASTRKNAHVGSPSASGAERNELRRTIAAFFRERREATGMTLEQVATSLPGSDVEQLRAYESGTEAIPLDLIFSLTNLYNIPPEDTLNLIHDVYGEQGRK